MCHRLSYAAYYDTFAGSNDFMAQFPIPRPKVLNYTAVACWSSVRKGYATAKGRFPTREYLLCQLLATLHDLLCPGKRAEASTVVADERFPLPRLDQTSPLQHVNDVRPADGG